MFGYSLEKLVTLTVEDLMPVKVRELHVGLRQMFFAKPQRRAMGTGRWLVGQRADGSQFPIDVMLSPLSQFDQQLLITTIRDVSARKRSEEQMNILHSRLSLATKAGGIGVWEWDIAKDTVVWDERMYTLFNVPQHITNMRYNTWRQLVHPDDIERTEDELQTTLAGMAKFTTEYRIIWPDKQIRTIRADAIVSRDNQGKPVLMTGINWDVTEQKQKEAAIKAALHEKEILLKELYHRVKNNLQVINSLFNLQASTIPEGTARTALKEGAERVRAMALVHEKFYQSKNLASIKLDEYINDLCEQLDNAAAAGQRKIHLTTRTESIQVGLETAIPLGLLLNELISNCLKHAFPDNRPGTITISLAQTENNKVELKVSDDGIGFPPEFDLVSSHTLGLKLASALSAQLDGKLSLETEHGAHALIIFPLAKQMKPDINIELYRQYSTNAL
jgi:PAS domain S-box-containing protein